MGEGGVFHLGAAAKTSFAGVAPCRTEHTLSSRSVLVSAGNLPRATARLASQLRGGAEVAQARGGWRVQGGFRKGGRLTTSRQESGGVRPARNIRAGVREYLTADPHTRVRGGGTRSSRGWGWGGAGRTHFRVGGDQGTKREAVFGPLTPWDTGFIVSIAAGHTQISRGDLAINTPIFIKIPLCPKNTPCSQSSS